MAVLLPKVAAAAVVCSIDWDSTNWWRGDHRPLEPTWHLARTWGMSAWGHWHWHQGMLPPSVSEALVPCATGRTYFHKHTFKTEGQNLAIHHLTSFVPKMNNLYYVNQPPFYIAYSNCMQRRRWQQGLSIFHAYNSLEHFRTTVGQSKRHRYGKYAHGILVVRSRHQKSKETFLTEK